VHFGSIAMLPTALFRRNNWSLLASPTIEPLYWAHKEEYKIAYKRTVLLGRTPHRRENLHRFQSVSAVTGATLDIVLTFQLVVAILIALFVAYNVFHYVLFLLVTQPKDASKIGHELNQFEQRQLIEWTPQPSDFLKHDDEKRTYDDVFGTYRDEQANYSTCVFPRVAFSRPYEAEYILLKLKDGMRLLDLGCGSGAAAYYLSSRRDIEIVCVTNSSVQADICRRKFAKLAGRGQVIVTDFDSLDLPSESFDAIYALESIGYTKNLDAWLARCWRMLKPGGSLLIRSPGSLDHCRRKEDFLSVTAFFDNWRYNFVGANLLAYKMRRLGFNPIRYRRLPFWAWGLTWNFIQHLVLWKYRLKMRTFVELERIIWRTSKVFVFGNPYNTVLATKPKAASCSRQTLASSEALGGVAETDR
jgi:SAM-dependent methyltransferase